MIGPRKLLLGNSDSERITTNQITALRLMGQSRSKKVKLKRISEFVHANLGWLNLIFIYKKIDYSYQEKL